MKGFCDRNLHPAAKQAKGHKALDATAWTPKSALVFSLKKLLAEHIMFSTKGQKPGKQITVSSILPENEQKIHILSIFSLGTGVSPLLQRLSISKVDTQ